MGIPYFQKLFAKLNQVRDEKDQAYIAKVQQRSNPGMQSPSNPFGSFDPFIPKSSPEFLTRLNPFDVCELFADKEGRIGAVIQNNSKFPLFVNGLMCRKEEKYNNITSGQMLPAGTTVQPGEKCRITAKKMPNNVEKVGGFNISYQDGPGDLNDEGKPKDTFTQPVKGYFKREGFLRRFKFFAGEDEAPAVAPAVTHALPPPVVPPSVPTVRPGYYNHDDEGPLVSLVEIPSGPFKAEIGYTAEAKQLPEPQKKLPPPQRKIGFTPN